MREAHVEIRAITSRWAHAAFCDLPYRLYGRDTRWVPPLRGEERDRWSPRRNASLRPRWTCRFLARRGHEVVGRIAVAVDPEFGHRWQPHAGFLGFFECARDPEAARALFAAAEDALRGQGVERVMGPVNLTTHDEVGLLVEGFDVPPTLLTSYNPPFYAELFEQNGFRPRLDYYAYHCDPMRPPDRLLERLTRANRENRGSLRVRSSDPRRWEAENRTLFELYNRSFDGVWGFVPLGWDEYRERADRFRPFYHPDLVVVAEWDGRPVGFAVALPDINVALAPLGGRLWPFGWVRLIRRAQRIDSLRLLLLGVLPEYTGRGIAARLAGQIAVTARRLNMRASELSLVQAGNGGIQRVIAAFGGQRAKIYRLYEKPLGI